MYCKLFTFLFVTAFFAGSTHAQPTSISLQDFFADPTVTVAVDGSSAVMMEDPGINPVILSNDPGLGDPAVIIAGPAVSLLFDFIFEEGPDSVDEFGAFIIDASTGLPVSGLDFFATSSSAGTVTFDLSGLASGVAYGLQFQLSADFANDEDPFSTVTISDVRLESGPAPIPEPGGPAIALLFIGSLVGMVRSFRPAAA